MVKSRGVRRYRREEKRRGKRLGYGAERMSEYSKGDIGVGRDSEGGGKTEFSGIGNNVE